MSAGQESRRRVLVVEDNADGRETLCLLLSLAGFAVESAADGVQGVERGLQWEPQAAVVDIGLPLLDGYGVASSLRRALHSDIVLIAMTAYSENDCREQGTAAGFDAFFVKPVDPRQLLERLRESGRTIKINPFPVR